MLPEQLPPRFLETQLQIDRSNLAAAAMRRGQDPPADLVLEELGGLRTFFVEQPRELIAAIRSNADRQTIEDGIVLIGMMGWQLERNGEHAPNVITYILDDRWPILRQKVNAFFRAFDSMFSPRGDSKWERHTQARNPLSADALTAFEAAVNELQTYLDLARSVIERYGVATETGHGAAEQGYATLSRSPIRHEGARQPEGTGELPAMLSAADLARYLRQPAARVDSFLRRYYEKHSDCRTEATNPRKGEARYLYRVADVWPALQAQLPKWRK